MHLKDFTVVRLIVPRTIYTKIILCAATSTHYVLKTGGHPDHHGHCPRWFWPDAGVWGPGVGAFPLLPAGALHLRTPRRVVKCLASHFCCHAQ